MTTIDLFAVAGFLALAVVTLPILRIRRAVLTASHRVGHLLVVGGVAVSGALYFQPQLAPASAESLRRGVAAAYGDVLPADQPELAWLAVAATLVLTVWPLLVLLEVARRLTRQSFLLDNLRRELVGSARKLEHGLTRTSMPPTPKATAEIETAIHAMRQIAGDPNARPAQPTLVIDHLQ